MTSSASPPTPLFACLLPYHGMLMPHNNTNRGLTTAEALRRRRQTPVSEPARLMSPHQHNTQTHRGHGDPPADTTGAAPQALRRLRPGLRDAGPALPHVRRRLRFHSNLVDAT